MLDCIIRNDVLIEWLLDERVFEIPEGVKIIATSAIKSKNNLEEIKFPSSLRFICRGAITSCLNLKKVFIPKDATVSDYSITETTIEYCDFLSSIFYCPKLNKIECENQNLKFHDAFLEKNTFYNLCECFYPEQLSDNSLKFVIQNVLEHISNSLIKNSPINEEWKTRWINFLKEHKAFLFPFIVYNIKNFYSLLSMFVISDLKLLLKIAIVKHAYSHNKSYIEQIEYIINYIKERDSNVVRTKNIDELINLELKDKYGITESIIRMSNVIDDERDYQNLYVEDIEGIKWLYSISNSDKTACIKAFLGVKNFIFVPEKLGGFPVKEISPFVFSLENYSSKVKKVLVTVENVRFPRMINYLPDYCFSSWSGLKSLTLPEDLVEIPECFVENCQQIKKICIPQSVERINDRAFYGCENLKDIIIPKQVSYIGLSSFSRCSSIENITFDFNEKKTYKSLKNIKELESYTQTNNKNTDFYKIKDGAFSYCESLKSIEIPEGVINLSDNILLECKNLTDVTLPKSLKFVGNAVFKNCPKLKNFNFKNDDFIIKSAYFEKRTLNKIVKVCYPSRFSSDVKKSVLDDVLKIINHGKESSKEWKIEWIKYFNDRKKSRYNEFLTNNDLRKFMIEEGLFTLSDTKNLVKIAREKEYAAVVSELLKYENENFSEEFRKKEKENSLISETFDINKIWNFKNLDDDSLCITNYKGKNTEVTVPEFINGKKVIGIGRSVFTPENNKLTDAEKDIKKSIKTIIILDNIKSISGNTFYNCSSLVSLRLPKGLKEIGASNKTAHGIYLNGCIFGTKIENLVLPESLEKINYCAFAFCSSLKEIVLPNNLKVIDSNAFEGTSSLREIVIPKSVKKIGADVFKESAIKKATVLSNNLSPFIYDMFKDCYNLEELELPEGMTEISDVIFQNCRALKVLKIPSTVENFYLENIKLLKPLFTFKVKKGSIAEKYMKSVRFIYQLY